MCEYLDACKLKDKCRFAHDSTELFDFAKAAEKIKEAEKNRLTKASKMPCFIVDSTDNSVRPARIKTRKEPHERKITIQINDPSPKSPKSAKSPKSPKSPVFKPIAIAARKIPSPQNCISSSFTSRSVQTDNTYFQTNESQTTETRIKNPDSGIIRESRGFDPLEEWRKAEAERRYSHPPSPPENCPPGIKMSFERSKSEPSPTPYKSSFKTINPSDKEAFDFNKLISEVVSYKDIPAPIQTNSSLEFSMLIDEFHSYATSPDRMAELVQLAHHLHSRKTEIMPSNVAESWAEHDDWADRPLSPVFSNTRPPTPIEKKDTSRFFSLSPEFASVFKEMEPGIKN